MAGRKDYMTTAEVAAALGVSKARVDQFARPDAKTGGPPRLASEKFGNSRLFARSDVEAFKKKQRRAGRPEGYSPKKGDE